MNVTASKCRRMYFPRRPTLRSGVPYASSGAGRAVFSAVNVSGTNFTSSAIDERLAQTFGVGLDLRELWHQRARLTSRRCARARR